MLKNIKTGGGYEEISQNRSFLMGFAILLVIIYHMFCWIHNPLGVFNIGYVGVDIFLFLSGLGLRNSWENNSTLKFYKNRLKRIYPLYFIAVFLMFMLFKRHWNILQLINNLTSIGFYTENGRERFDWFLESLFTLYIIFPFFYSLKTHAKLILSLLFIICCGIFYFSSIEWYYDCLIGRLPIFIYGIFFKDIPKSIIPVSIIGLFIYFPVKIFCSQFLASSLLVCPIILGLLTCYRFLQQISDNLRILGIYSLEIYVANVFVYQIIQRIYRYIQDPILTMIMYCVIQIIITFGFIWINRNVQNLYNKINYKIVVKK